MGKIASTTNRRGLNWPRFIPTGKINHLDIRDIKYYRNDSLTHMRTKGVRSSSKKIDQLDRNAL